MNQDVERLVTLMDRLAQLLSEHNEPEWGHRVACEAAWLRAGDGYGVIHFLGAFGGMGSLNDVAFHPQNGNVATMEEATRLNAELRELRNETYALASRLRHDAQLAE